MTKTVKNKLLQQLNFLKSIGYDYHENLKLSNNNIDNSVLPNNITDLESLVQNCYLCELSKSRNNILFGQGNINASLMFISDEPTSSEDELKSFFVGKTGEQLARMIENVLPLKKEDIYVTSLVKCKSLNGINMSHYDACNSYLDKQIDLVNPKIIITLGEKAYQYLTNDTSVFKQIRGQELSFKNYKLIPTHSMSFIIRNIISIYSGNNS